MSQPFDNEAEALTKALRGELPPKLWYERSVDLDKAFSGSANHKMQANPTLALVGLNTHKPAMYTPVMDWLEFYVQPSNPLHENEAFTSHSYRPAITTGTFVLAGVAHECGRDDLRDKALARSRADIAWIVLGVAVAVAKKVRNHYLQDQGIAHLFLGDGEPDTVIGINLPTFAQAGKRSHLRSGGSANHFGPIEGTNNSALSALVAQALGFPSPLAFRGIFGLACKRWPDLPPYGLSGEDVGVLRAFIQDPKNIITAQAVYKMARDFRPMLPFAFVRYDDGAIETFARETDGSSTGAKAVDTVLADGTHYIGSADNGKRNPPNVQPQKVTETAVALICRWKSGEGADLLGPRPKGRELYRVETTQAGAQFLVGGSPAIPITPDPTPPTRPIVVPKPRKPWWMFW